MNGCDPDWCWRSRETSLALAVAGASTGSFPDGCWFAELASASTAEEVVRAVDRGDGGLGEISRHLARFLADRRALIVLDNCEHLLPTPPAWSRVCLVLVLR